MRISTADLVALLASASICAQAMAVTRQDPNPTPTQYSGIATPTQLEERNIFSDVSSLWGEATGDVASVYSDATSAVGSVISRVTAENHKSSSTSSSSQTSSTSSSSSSAAKAKSGASSSTSVSIIGCLPVAVTAMILAKGYVL